MLALPSRNFDVGDLARLGTYQGADEAYAKLVAKLADHKFAGKADWEKLMDQLKHLLRSSTGSHPEGLYRVDVSRPLAVSKRPWLATLEKRRSAMIRKLKSGEYRLYSRKTDSTTKKRKNLGTFSTREAAEKHERVVQYFKCH
jgi:hypothetical protein